MGNREKSGILLSLILCMILTFGACGSQPQEPGVTKPTPPPIPEKPSVSFDPTPVEHPLKDAYEQQPNAYVMFTQTHQQPGEVYVPVEEIMAYTTKYPDCNGTWFRDQLQGEDLLIYNCYLYALENCYLSFSVYVEDNDRDFAYLREAVSMDTPLMEQNVNQYGEWNHSWATNHWGEELYIRLEQFSVDRWAMRMEALEKCRQIVAEIPEEYTQLEKMEYVFRYVLDHVEYVEYESMKDENYLYDAVIKGQTVCDGYSNMLMLLFRLIGVECCEASGYAVDITSDEPYEDAGGHTWVVAKVDGNWYNFDATFADSANHEWCWEGMYFGFSDRRLNTKYLNCENIRPKCTELSRDFPTADLTVTDVTDGAQVKKIARLVEKRMKEGQSETVIGLHDIMTEDVYNTMMKKYQKYTQGAYRLEINRVEFGSSCLIRFTATKE